METRRSSKGGYEYDSSRSRITLTSDGGGLFRLLKRAVGTTVAGAVVGGPLFVGMGITFALTVSLGVIGIPVMLIFTPLLIIPCFILGTAIVGFTIAALLALAGISTLNSVFPHHSFDVSAPKSAPDDIKESKQQETIEEEDRQHGVPSLSTVSEAADKDAGQVEEEEESKNVTISKEKVEEEEEEEEEEDETTAATPQTPLAQPDSAAPADTSTSQKKQLSQKSKKQKPKK